MPKESEVIEWLEKIREQNDEILSLLKKDKPEAETQDAPPDDPPPPDPPKP